ncbi:hypothetical protein J6590_083513 [Homalodisca vitripennis]|nr:hypothetical protein J6590_083513 [Homalodisca vitripennis]
MDKISKVSPPTSVYFSARLSVNTHYSGRGHGHDRDQRPVSATNTAAGRAASSSPCLLWPLCPSCVIMDVEEIAVTVHVYRHYIKRRRRRYWIHPMLQSRPTRGQFFTFFYELRLYEETFFNYTRMSVASFDQLLNKIADSIRGTDTSMRPCIGVEEKLLVTLSCIETCEYWRLSTRARLTSRLSYIMSKKPSGSEYRKRAQERNERESALLNKIHRLDDFFNKPETPSCSAKTLPVVTGTERNVVSEDSGVIVEVEVIQQPASATATDVSDTTTEIAPVHVPSPPSTE